MNDFKTRKQQLRVAGKQRCCPTVTLLVFLYLSEGMLNISCWIYRIAKILGITHSTVICFRCKETAGTRLSTLILIKFISYFYVKSTELHT